MADISELVQRIKAAAEKASVGDWVQESGDGWDAICSNNDQANGGFIIAHFEGPDAAVNRNFVQSANPANILTLTVVLEKAQARIAELESRTVKLPEHFYPDGDIDCPLVLNEHEVIEALAAVGVPAIKWESGS